MLQNDKKCCLAIFYQQQDRELLENLSSASYKASANLRAVITKLATIACTMAWPVFFEHEFPMPVRNAETSFFIKLLPFIF